MVGRAGSRAQAGGERTPDGGGAGEAGDAARRAPARPPRRRVARGRGFLATVGLAFDDKRHARAMEPVSRVRSRRPRSYDSGVDISSLLPTPSTATTAAREIVVRYSSAALVNHCERSYLWSASLGRLKGIPYDAELLYVASMLHDLGLVPAFDNHLAPFEDAGGDVGWVFGAGAGWAGDRRDRIKEIIVRHMWPEVDPALDAEGHLLCEGTA